MYGRCGRVGFGTGFQWLPVGILPRINFWATGVEESDAIHQEKIDSLVKTMPERIEAVIQADEGHTKW